MKRILAAVLLLVGSSIATPRSAVVIPSARPSGGDAATSAVALSATPGGTGQRPTGAPLDPGGNHSAGEVRESAVGWHRYPDQVPGGAPQPRTASEPIAPSGAISTAILGGIATWFDACAKCAAAGPALRSMLGPSWRGTVVTVEGPAGASVTVVLSEWCQCGDRHGLDTLIDLSRQAFSRLAHPSAGIVAVTIELPAQLPRTDTEDER